MTEQDVQDVSEGVTTVVLDDLGQAFERLYHAVARRNKAEDAKTAADQESTDALVEHQAAWQAVQELQQGKAPVVPEQ